MTELTITPHERLVVATHLVDTRVASVAECVDLLKRCSKVIYHRAEPPRMLLDWLTAATTKHLDVISKVVGVAHTPDMLAHWVMTGEGSPAFDLLAVGLRYGSGRPPSEGLLLALTDTADRLRSYMP